MATIYREQQQINTIWFSHLFEISGEIIFPLFSSLCALIVSRRISPFSYTAIFQYWFLAAYFKQYRFTIALISTEKSHRFSKSLNFDDFPLLLEACMKKRCKQESIVAIFR